MVLPVLTEEEKKSIYLQLVDAWSSTERLLELFNPNTDNSDKKTLFKDPSDLIGFCLIIIKFNEVKKFTEPIEDMYDSDRNTRQLDDVLEDIKRIRLHVLKQVGFIPQAIFEEMWYSSFDDRVKELERLKDKYK